MLESFLQIQIQVRKQDGGKEKNLEFLMQSALKYEQNTQKL